MFDPERETGFLMEAIRLLAREWAKCSGLGFAQLLGPWRVT